MYNRIEQLQGTQTEMAESVKRQAELELQLIQLQSHLEIAVKDKKQAEGDLDNLRDKIKNLLKDKIELENNFNMIQKHEITRLNELEQKFQEISEQYIKSKEEVQVLRMSELRLKEQLQQAEQARQNYKDQYLEMREVNKMLKLDFGKLQSQFEKLGEKERDYDFNDTRPQKERKKMRYYSSDDDVDETESQEKFDRLDASSQILNQEHAARYNPHKSGYGRSSKDYNKENLRESNLITNQKDSMGAIQETKKEDKSFRKRANMLSDIQSMIIDYKKKS